MRQANSRQFSFSRRALVLGGAGLLGFSVLGGRLYWLQFIKAAEYKTLAEDNRIKLLLLPPPRGSLFDRNGLPLARNKKNHRILIENGKKAEIAASLDALSKIIPLTDEDIARIMNQAKPSLFAPPLLVRENISWEELTKVEFNAPDLPGVEIETGQVRHYPLGPLAAHLIGYVGAVSEKDLEDQSLLRLPDFKIGKNGVEKLLELPLRGKPGIRQVEVNVHGQPVRALATQEATTGEAPNLTIDSRLQRFISERLGEQSGAAMVMDVTNGDVLALVSMPGFDPNIFSLGIPQDYWKELNENPKNPLLNKAISGQYPPGSTFKMLVGLAGLEKGSITPQSRVSCPGYFMLGNHRFNCWKPQGHGSVDIHGAIAGSCDAFFYTVAQRTGIDAIAEMARRFGLGEEPGLGLAGERGGVVPDSAWKQKRYKQPWQGGDTINAGIGQGYVLATPAQLCVMTARIANGGLMVKPRLIAPKDPTDEIAAKPMGLAPEILEAVQRGMNAVVNENIGTAYAQRITEPRFAMAGKTGTSQVKRITVRGRDQNSLPWEDRHHALFVGYAPVENPKYACCVLIEHGGGGASTAAPIAKDILLRTQQLAEEPVTQEERDAAFQL